MKILLANQDLQKVLKTCVYKYSSNTVEVYILLCFMTSIFGTNISKNRWKVLSISNDLNSVKFLKEALTQKKYPVVAGSSLSFT